MAIAFIAGASGGGSTGFTSSSINTTGATLLVATVARYSGGGSNPLTISDSKGNTWTAMTGWTSSGTADTMQAWYSIPTSVGSGHTVTLTKGAGANPFAGGGFAAFSGTKATSPLDLEVQLNNSGSSTTHTATSITPSENDCLIVQMLGTDGASYSSINSSYSLAFSNNWTGGIDVSSALAYIVQTTASASAPTITLDASAGAGIGTASFKAASAASQIKTWDGVTQANVKNFLGATNAQTKSWVGVTNV